MDIGLGEEPPPVAIEDEAIVLKILLDQDGEPDLMVWTSVSTPDQALMMLSAAIQVVITRSQVREPDHE